MAVKPAARQQGFDGARSAVKGGGARKVGLLVGREWSFPPKFIEEVNKRDQGVVGRLFKRDVFWVWVGRVCVRFV